MSSGSGPVRPSISLGVGTVDIDRSLEARDPPQLDAVAESRLVVTLEGEPIAQLRLPHPGALAGDGYLRSTVLAAADQPLRRRALARSLRRRIGAPEPAPSRRSVSVVVCTHRRRDQLKDFLSAAAALDPPPAELVVVDNAPPPGEDCRDLARGAGAVYVREDRKGLNNARTAGISAASSELIAFTDDDCLPPPRWLAALDELFDDANAGAVTGPAFPASLDTPSQARFEEAASFVRRLEQRRFDFTSISPADANHTGAGANMIVRRSLLLELRDPFPPELDAGTPTESGGDLYALYRILAAGRRIVYDPRVFTYHAHRAEPGALHRAVYGYGVGLSAATTKLLLEERELAALRIWRWLVEQYLEAVVRGLTGNPDPVRVRVGWDYLRGGLAGPGALLRARRRQGPARPLPAPPPEPRPSLAARPAEGPPELCAVVITHRAPEMVARSLAALAAQGEETPAFEVVLVDDSPAGLTRDLNLPEGVRVRRLETGGIGAAGARNAGVEAAGAPVLLFLDDDLVAAPGLVARHAELHRDAVDRVVVGYSRPSPALRTQAALSASLWWEDHFLAKRDALAPTFVDVLSGNMSVRRETFARIGPFDARFGRWRREDWDWGIRALEAGVELRYAPEAHADHRFVLTTRGRLAAARAEGRGDALLLERYPFALPAVHAGRTVPRGGRRARILHELLERQEARALVTAWLDLLERLHSRTTWGRWWNIAQAAAYEQGFAEGGGDRAAAAARVPVLTVELGGSAPLPTPRPSAPVLEMRANGRRAAVVLPSDGHWNGALARRAADTVPPWALDQTEALAPAAARHAGEASAGAAVEVLPLERTDAEAWRALDRALRVSTAPIVAVLLPGTEPGERWIAMAAEPLDASRVAAVFGGVRPDGACWPARILAPRSVASPYTTVRHPPSFLLLRREAWLGSGGFGNAALGLGGLAPVLDSVERLLGAELLVAERDLPGRVRAMPQRARVEAQAALIAVAARERGWSWGLRRAAAPALLRIADGWRRGRRKEALSSAAAFAAGLGRGALWPGSADRAQ